MPKPLIEFLQETKVLLSAYETCEKPSMEAHTSHSAGLSSQGGQLSDSASRTSGESYREINIQRGKQNIQPGKGTMSTKKALTVPQGPNLATSRRKRNLDETEPQKKPPNKKPDESTCISNKKLENDIKEIRRENARLTKELYRAEGERNRAQELLQSTENTNRALRFQVNEMRSSRSSTVIMQPQIGTSWEQAQNPASKGLGKKIGRLEEANIRLREENCKLRGGIKKHGDDYSKLKKVNEELHAENSELEKGNIKLKGENSELEKENTKLKGENSELEKENTKLKGENSKMSKDINQHEEVAKELTKAYDEISAKNEGLEKKNRDLEKSVDDLRVENNNNQLWLSRIKGENEALNMKRIKMNEECSSLKGMKEASTRLSELNVGLKTTNEELQNANDDLRRTNSELMKLNADSEIMINNLEATKLGLEEERKKLNEKIGSLQCSFDSQEEQLKKLRFLGTAKTCASSLSDGSEISTVASSTQHKQPSDKQRSIRSAKSTNPPRTTRGALRSHNMRCSAVYISHYMGASTMSLWSEASGKKRRFLKRPPNTPFKE